MTSAQDRLRDQLAAFDPCEAATRPLLDSYYRAVLRRLVTHGLGIPTTLVVQRRPRWLHPRTVWAVASSSRDDRAVSEDLLREIREDIRSMDRDPPPIRLLPAPAAPWARHGYETLTRGAPSPPADQDAVCVDAGGRTSEVRRAVAAARDVLGEVWPDALVELDSMIRALVLVDDPGFRSASLESTFGAIYVGLHHHQTTLAAVDMLLHETGHHALFLTTSFDRIVVNPRDVVTHPLRPDPRPISGTVHAAQALGRVAGGLSRWASSSGAPSAVHDRLDHVTSDLEKTLAVLARSARWTPVGERFFRSLCRSAAASGVTRVPWSGSAGDDAGD